MTLVAHLSLGGAVVVVLIGAGFVLAWHYEQRGKRDETGKRGKGEPNG